jgi:putative ABC transport system ATP-binding protein
MDELLALRGVRLHYWRGRRHVVGALEDVSMRVWSGELVCVLAGRGQGKTTLLRVAAGMERPGRGEVSFAGQDVWAMSDVARAELLARQIGWVRREEPELDASVLAQISMSLSRAGGRREAYARAERALASVGLAGGGGLSWASLGDRERALVAVAAAIVREPQLLVADDLAVGLDAVEVDDVMRLLASLAHKRGLGVLASVGSVGETRWSDRLATLSGGELLMSRRSRADGEDEVLDLPS